MITILLATTALSLPGDDAAWNNMTNRPTKVECTETADGQPWCRSTALFDSELSTLQDTLYNMDKHSDKFEAIVELHKLTDEIMHVVMDFPAPLQDRDYVASYTREEKADGTVVISWVPATHDQAPVSDNRVRLERFAGSWQLIPGSGTTTVVYTWQGEYGGALPSWTLNAARKKTGAEAIKDLAGAAGGVKFSAP